MFEFHGSISEDNKKVIIRKEKTILFLASIIPFLVGISITIIIAIKIDLIYLLFLIPLLFFIFIPFFPLTKKTLDLIIPVRIWINQEVVLSEGNNFKCSKQTADIKEIVDYGSYYFIYFKWPKKSYKFLCQKNLIITGNIDDFEKHFKTKIRKKS